MYLFAQLISHTFGQIGNYEIAKLIVRVKFPPGQCGPYSFVVQVTNELKVCGLQVN